MDWPVGKLEREISKVAAIGIGACVLIGTLIGIVVDTLVHHIRDEGISDHFNKG